MPDIVTIAPKNPLYPKLLLETPDHPKQLYVSGNTNLLNEKYVLGVIGTRKCTGYGLSVAEKMARQAAEAGIVIVSGLARGIDAAAHKAALSAGGKTIAVLGSGIDQKSIYPAEHKSLALQIIERDGLVMSEYPQGTRGLKFHFPARNRIVAGICQAVLVVEAPEKSGALITASLSLDYNRDVLAVPGAITNNAALGSNKLIKEGARVILGIEDILNVFGIAQAAQTVEKAISLNAEQRSILDIISSHGPLNLNDISDRLNIDFQTVSHNLTLLELSDFVISCKDGYMVKA